MSVPAPAPSTDNPLQLVSMACLALIRHPETGIETAAAEAARQLDCVAALPGLDAQTARLICDLRNRCQALSCGDCPRDGAFWVWEDR